MVPLCIVHMQVRDRQVAELQREGHSRDESLAAKEREITVRSTCLAIARNEE